MSKQNVWVPADFVLTSGLNASAKLVWVLLAQRIPAPSAPLHRTAGLDPRTVRLATAKLEAAGWLQPPERPGALPIPVVKPAARTRHGNVRYPIPLLTNASLSAEARVLFGQLQALGLWQSDAGQFTYPALSQTFGSTPGTLRRAAIQLVNAGWLALEQPNRKRPIQFTLRNPIRDDPVERARRHIDTAPFRGEAIMKEYLTLLVDAIPPQDNVRLWFMLNPWTGERLELDRYYESAKVAFEYNGSQHERVTELGSWDEFLKQSALDDMKRNYCARDNIHLVVVRAPDLSLAGMKAKVGSLLPLRTLTPDDARLIQMLENKAEAYRAKSPTG